MKATVREWVDRAEADYEAARLMRRSRKKRSRDIVCFHLQQCVEKYLKGRLEEAGSKIPRIHDLPQLLDLTLKHEPLWAVLRPAMMAITVHAVESRYPGRIVTPAEARRVQRATDRIRTLVRERLGLR